MREEILKTLACQQCLNDLSIAQNKLVCNECGNVYPVSNELVFMGYEKKKKNGVLEIIRTEKEHQTNLEKMQKHYTFAYSSFKIGLLALQILKHDIKTPNPTAIDIGSGGAPMSKLLAENGFDTYRCELEPNSLYSGLLFEHPNLQTGKHIVCDCRLLPFKSNVADVVLCKEFVHHIYDYYDLFAEINRVLKKNGIFLMIEPATGFIQTLKDKILPSSHNDKFGHSYQNIFNYLSALKKNGFAPYRYNLFFPHKHTKLTILNGIENYYHKQTCSTLNDLHTSKIDMFFKLCLQGLKGGGSNIIFSKKIKHITAPKQRPEIQIVQPAELVLSKEFLNDTRWKKLREILNDVQKNTYEFAQLSSNRTV